jgi:hypothetical protein
MAQPEIKDKDWMIRAKATHRRHVELKRENPKQTIIDTAHKLGRSKSSIADDLTVVQWLKTHELELRKFSYLQDALEFIRKKKQQLAVEQYDD